MIDRQGRRRRPKLTPREEHYAQLAKIAEFGKRPLPGREPLDIVKSIEQSLDAHAERERHRLLIA